MPAPRNRSTVSNNRPHTATTGTPAVAAAAATPTGAFCGTPRAGQWVVDVARHDEPSLGQPGVQAGQVNPGQSGQRPPAVVMFFTGRVEQPPPQRLHHPGASVGAGASSDAEHDRVTSVFQCGSHDLAGAVRTGL